jgi:hypothetical protein
MPVGNNNKTVTKPRPKIKVPKRAIRKGLMGGDETFADLVFKPLTIKFQHQNENEHTLMLVREHVMILWFRLIGAVVGVIVPVLILILYQFLEARELLPFDIEAKWFWAGALLWFMFLIVGAFRNFIDWFYNINLMTTERFIDLDFDPFGGFEVKETPLMKIQDASDTHSGIWQMVFDMGNLEILTASEHNSFQLNNVPASSQVRDFVMDTVIAYTDQFKSDDIINVP